MQRLANGDTFVGWANGTAQRVDADGGLILQGLVMSAAGVRQSPYRILAVPSLYQYQRGWNWLPVIEAAGFRQVALVHPTRCHARVLGALTNGLQFVGLWERTEPA